jgi:hypothetical protein
MGRIVRDHVAASTNVDLHGERIPPETLREIFDDMPESFLLNHEHSLSRPPVGRAFNKRLVELDGGALAILLDVEVLDEEAYERSRGMSISVTSRQPVLSEPGSVLTAQVLFDPNQFDSDGVAAALTGLGTEEYGLIAIERRQKYHVGEEYTHLVQVGSGIENDIWVGFWTAVGVKLLDILFKTKPKTPAEEVVTRVEVIASGSDDVEVVLRLAGDTEADDVAGVLPEGVLTEARGAHPSADVRRVVVDVQKGGSYVVRFVSEQDGTVHGDESNGENAR